MGFGGGAPGGPTRPQIPDSCMGQVVGMYSGSARPISRRACTVLSTSLDCSILYRSRRPPVDAGYHLCPPRRGCMSPTRTQALSSAAKELELCPFERNVACSGAPSRPPHGCHVSLTAWDPGRFLDLPGSVLSGQAVRPAVVWKRTV